MTDPDKVVVAVFILFLLGLSYVFAVAVLASGYLLPATAAYLVVAVVLLFRVITKKENR